MSTASARGAMDDALTPTHEEISARAYELYMERPVGAATEMDDWLQAERELMTARTPRSAPGRTRRVTRLAVEHDFAGK